MHIHKVSLKLNKRRALSICRIAVYLFFVSSALAQVKEVNSFQEEAILLRSALEKNHYSPRVLDDKFSSQVFYRFVNLLDPHHLYFTGADLKVLSVYKPQIDNELNGNSWKFLPLITDLYKQRLVISEKTFSEILQKPFDFSTGQKISFSKGDDSLAFARDEKDYTIRWVRWQ